MRKIFLLQNLLPVISASSTIKKPAVNNDEGDVPSYKLSAHTLFAIVRDFMLALIFVSY